MITNNPLALLMQAAQTGGNPVVMLQQMAMQNPQIAQAYRLIQGKDARQLQAMAQNIARERGIDLNEVAQSLGINPRR